MGLFRLAVITRWDKIKGITTMSALLCKILFEVISWNLQMATFSTLAVCDFERYKTPIDSSLHSSDVQTTGAAPRNAVQAIFPTFLRVILKNCLTMSWAGHLRAGQGRPWQPRLLPPWYPVETEWPSVLKPLELQGLRHNKPMYSCLLGPLSCSANGVRTEEAPPTLAWPLECPTVSLTLLSLTTYLEVTSQFI